MRVLLIDQGSLAIDLLAQRLEGCGFKPEVVRSLDEATQSPAAPGALAMVLDLGLEASCACAAITPLREAGLAQPLVVLSARDDWRERVAAFDAGADDFLLKPVHSEEVAARTRAAIRRSAGSPSRELVLGDLTLDMKARTARQGDRNLPLTRSEFRLLQLFLLAPGRVLTKQQITESLWPGNREVSANAVEVLIARLRQKLGTGRIITLRGQGYCLDEAMQAERLGPG